MIARRYPRPTADTGADQSRQPAHTSPCDCTDPDLEQLVGLVADGVGQWEASRTIWGGGL